MLPQAPAGYTAHAPVMEYISPEPLVYAVPAPDVEYFSTAPEVIHAAPAFAVSAAKAPVVEYIAPAPVASYVAHAPTVFPAPAPVVENISPAPAVYAAPDPELEYIAPAAAGYAGPATDEEKYFISMTRLEDVNFAALTIQRGWRWTRKRIVLRAASEERLQEKLREFRRRLVACLPVGARAKEKTESLRAATRRHLQSWCRTRHHSELAHTSLHLVFGMENMHPDCSAAAESWLAQERSRHYGR